jgi:hypothetical protein
MCIFATRSGERFEPRTDPVRATARPSWNRTGHEPEEVTDVIRSLPAITPKWTDTVHARAS